MALFGLLLGFMDLIQRSLWKELAGLISWWDMLRCLGGDFITFFFPSDMMNEGSTVFSHYVGVL
jgi:hypothetical protein